MIYYIQTHSLAVKSAKINRLSVLVCIIYIHPYSSMHFNLSVTTYRYFMN